MYRVLRKKVPDNLRPLKRGGFSRAKNQKMTFEWAKHLLAEVAKKRGIEPKDMWADNTDLLMAMRDKDPYFFLERRIEKTPQQLEDAIAAVRYEGELMTDPDVPIFARGGFHCRWCPFEEPCSLREIGGDWRGLLAATYNTRTYWEGDEEE
jgi:hypothetical protein